MTYRGVGSADIKGWIFLLPRSRRSALARLPSRISIPPIPIIKPEHAERGAQAEADFQGWLDQSRLPYVYATQDRASAPTHYRRILKRPDDLVALPYVGTLAFDVKSKTPYEGGFLFDVAEVQKLAHFDDLLRVSTFFACLDPSGSPQSVWFRIPELLHCPTRKTKGKPVYAVAMSAGIALDMARPFQEALRDTMSLR